MPLRFNGAWRFNPPANGAFRNSNIPRPVVEDCLEIIFKVATQGDLQTVLEHFKGFFCTAIGTTHVWSSSPSWAETDLRDYMEQAATNAPLFIEAMIEACRKISRIGEHFYAPQENDINAILAKYRVGYEIRGDELLSRDQTTIMTAEIPMPPPPATIEERSIRVLNECLSRSDQLLADGRYREAVQEILWLLETVVTAFCGLETETGTVEGKYFNQIVQDLKRGNQGTRLNLILKWVEQLYGYLSSPTGGGVRHGIDLQEGVELKKQDARLFCNLTRSYIAFLLAEHERISLA